MGSRPAAVLVWMHYNGGEPPPNYEVHHLCERRLCVEPTHLKALHWEDHMNLHRLGQRQDECSVHGMRYLRRSSRGWGICPQCAREATARWRAANPEKIAAYNATEAAKESQRAAGRRYSQTAKGKERNKLDQRKLRARRKAQLAALKKEAQLSLF